MTTSTEGSSASTSLAHLAPKLTISSDAAGIAMVPVASQNVLYAPVATERAQSFPASLIDADSTLSPPVFAVGGTTVQASSVVSTDAVVRSTPVNVSRP